MLPTGSTLAPPLVAVVPAVVHPVAQIRGPHTDPVVAVELRTPLTAA